jgi:hypothetical protein
MIRFHAPFDGKRYIGDNRLKIFHDCLYETSQYVSGGCAIERIPVEEVRTFEPDTLGEAWRRGFVHCPHCRHDEKVVQK